VRISELNNTWPLLSSLDPDIILDDNIKISDISSFLREIEYQSLVKMLHSDAWPAAVDPSFICDSNSEDDKFSRADAILAEASIELKDKVFLDFGCGEAHICERALDWGVKASYGYDISSSGWDKRAKNDNLFLTGDFQSISSRKYDVIFLYDVIDHSLSPYSMMQSIKSILADSGKIYVVCHPWCSKHGSHLYQQINKAYIHLVFTDDEIEKMGYKLTYTRKIIHPLGEYYKMFDMAGLRRVNEKIVKDHVEPFFQTPIIANRIKQRWLLSPDDDLSSGRRLPIFQIEQRFCEFVLRH
jgi:2-polyprenyl-3-methyl-5-hydroxy-6-metoxy-1,4-benzoquinol methylase